MLDSATGRYVFGVKGEPLKLQQVYRCVQETCPRYRRDVLSWLTIEEANYLLGGMRCMECRRALKWIRAQPLHPNPAPPDTDPEVA